VPTLVYTTEAALTEQSTQCVELVEALRVDEPFLRIKVPMDLRLHQLLL
jgi:hypothetical protein